MNATLPQYTKKAIMSGRRIVTSLDNPKRNCESQNVRMWEVSKRWAGVDGLMDVVEVAVDWSGNRTEIARFIFSISDGFYCTPEQWASM